MRETQHQEPISDLIAAQNVVTNQMRQILKDYGPDQMVRVTRTHAFGSSYVTDIEVLDGSPEELSTAPSGEPRAGHPTPGEMAEEEQRRTRRQRRQYDDEFLRNNDTDGFGNCFSDADPGL